MKMSKSIEGFIISRLADGYSKVTVDGYKYALFIIAKYLEDPEIESITAEQLKQFMAWIKTEYVPKRSSGNTDELSTASHNRYWKAIRCYFRWANEDLGIPRPDLQLKMPKFTTREIVPLTQNEIERLLRSCEYAKTVTDGKRKPYACRRPTAKRDRALLLTLLDTGIRAGECSRLLIRDFNQETGEINIRPHQIGKTRPRTVYLGKVARKALWKYLSTREDIHPDDPLFLSIYDRPMTIHAMRQLVYDIAAAAGVQNVHPHKFRHTFAIMALRNGMDVFSLQRILGHATLEMVRKYLALADGDAENAHRLASPADRLKL
jgi:integrase/recombinase XerD